MIQEDMIPARSKDLIQRLDEVYPARVKAIGEPEDEHQRYAGVRDLIDELIGLLEEQERADDN